MEGREPIVSIVGLTRQYRMGPTVVWAVAGVDLDIMPGEGIALVGASGSGKSTLLNLLGGLDRPSGGRISVEGEDIATASPKRLVEHRRRRVGFIFQSFNLIAQRTALENVEVPLMISGVGHEERRRRARELLERVGLAARTDHRPSQLSGGEQQRVAVARALANKPSLLLADEPTGNLDSATGAEVMSLLSELKAGGLTVVLVTHDMAVANYMDRIIRLKDGKIVGAGLGGGMMADPLDAGSHRQALNAALP
ncbi:MAG: ABC transporter ATP-binding protein [Chloroflexota bacterium]|nr:ABC transporter ATP-binding protein [Chloroflexota bacterium]